MVKKWIVILSILILLVIGCVLEYKYVNGAFEYLENCLIEYRAMIAEDNKDGNIDTIENVTYLEKMHNKWNKKNDLLKSLIWHTGIKDIEIGIARIKTYTEENNYTEAKTELEALIDYLQHYSDDFILSWDTFL